MYLLSYGTRPELIKLFPLINKMEEEKIPHATLFTGQHRDLISEFKDLVSFPTFELDKVMTPNQSINALLSKIINKSDLIVNNKDYRVIVQGDAASTYAIALSAFNNKKEVIHLEAGLRTHNLNSPFPEEGYRKMISQIANVHLCPTEKATENLNLEGISENVHLVGNTIVDSYKLILNKGKVSSNIEKIIENSDEFYLCTLHRRENREHFYNMWSELNEIAEHKKIIYITHPSVPNSRENLSEKIVVIEPVNYQDMVYLIDKSAGVISDSGGVQEEVVCMKKKILICRNNTERPETVDSGYGKIVGKEIKKNIHFLEANTIDSENKNPYGENVTSKILKLLEN
jgi:UDP-N-acetylglucosamine 2-epimerase (non-hydrolysing)